LIAPLLKHKQSVTESVKKTKSPSDIMSNLEEHTVNEAAETASFEKLYRPY
jgi:hypothetical protein